MVVIIEVDHSKRRLLRTYFEVMGKQVLVYQSQEEISPYLSHIEKNNVDVLWLGDGVRMKNDHFINKIRLQLQPKLCIVCAHDAPNMDSEACVVLPRDFSIYDVHKLVEKFSGAG